MISLSGGSRFRDLIIVLLVLLILVPIAVWKPDRLLELPPPNSAIPALGFSMPSGYYEEALDIKIAASDEDAAIYFTNDGSVPTVENGTLYTGPVHFPADTPRAVVLRARPILSNGEMGPVQNVTYFIGIDAEIPLISLVIDPQDLWDERSGIFANPHFRGREWERQAEMFLYDSQLGVGTNAPVGVRVHGAGSRVYDKLSMRLYFRDDYGQPFLEYPVFPNVENNHHKRLILHDGGQDFPAVSFNGTLLRNHLMGNLAREAGGFATRSRPALLFINGVMWGVYNIRERIDDRYLANYFGINEADLLSGFEHNLEASYGDSTHWEHLIEYVTANDLIDEDNYSYVQTQINIENFIDYALMQIVTANADWPHNNQLKFRDRNGGRWHWMFWDSDYAFGLNSNSYIEKNMFEHILDHEDERQQQSTLLLRKLLQNPQFRTRFLSRLADLLNTVFSSDNVLAEIEWLAAGLEKDISYETRRWPGPGNWWAGVDYMREFARRRPDIVRRQTAEAFGLPGTSLLTVDHPSTPGGTITINGGIQLESEDLPWQGEYFQSVDVQLSAVPAPGYRFSGWDPAHLPQDPTLVITLEDDLTIRPKFEPRVEHSFIPGSVVIAGHSRDRGTLMEQNAAVDGDWVLLQVRDPGGVDLRGWRITDNDSLAVNDEGSLIFTNHPSLASLPLGTEILLVIATNASNDRLIALDDLSYVDGRLVLYAGNSVLDGDTDPWFSIGKADNLVLLAPGPTPSMDDDLVIDSRVVEEATTP